MYFNIGLHVGLLLMCISATQTPEEIIRILAVISKAVELKYACSLSYSKLCIYRYMAVVLATPSYVYTGIWL